MVISVGVVKHQEEITAWARIELLLRFVYIIRSECVAMRAEDTNQAQRFSMCRTANFSPKLDPTQAFLHPR